MTDHKHTPGPWAINKRAAFVVETTDGDSICSVGSSSLPHDEHVANAHAIAAVPDLIEALERIGKVVPDGGWNGHWWQKAARAALAKARGE